ncbi:MAG TPA: hypothetical protein VK886_03550 [Vicinamibacterales bacterium]|nr:hypothetical protein [Vicinamibacterales bacterium]
MTVVTGWACWTSLSAAPERPDIETVLTHVGERVAEYYRRAQTVVGVERSTVQPIGWSWTAEGLARTVESDVRVEYAADDGGRPEPSIIRTVRRINGRQPNERDKTDRSGCTDPGTPSPEPLAFLLLSHREEFRFTSISSGKEQGRAALIIDFRSANRTGKPELLEDPRGHADCFDWSGPIAARGRVWVDTNTYDVLRVDRHNVGPVDVRVPWKLQRRYQLQPWILVERDDLTLRYKPVSFSDPEEVIVLPESLVALTMVRSGLQSIRRTDTFRDYRRFLTTSRMVK